jgi:hypothetical protein
MLVAGVVVCVPSPQTHNRPLDPDTFARNETNNPFALVETIENVKSAERGGQVDTVSE